MVEILEEQKKLKNAWGDENERMLMEKVVAIRKNLNITQTELAQLSGNSQQDISRLEKQKHSPSIRTLCRIMNSIGYELSITKKTVGEFTNDKGR